MPPFSEIAAQLGSEVEIPPSVEEKDNSPEGKEARRLARMARCGWLIDGTDAGKGRSKKLHQFCGDARCKTCRGFRVNDVKRQFELANREHELRIWRVADSEEKRATLERLGKENYYCLPGEHEDIVVINADCETGAKLGQLAVEVELDWEKLAPRVKGRKRSGQLGQESQPVAVAEIETGIDIGPVTYTDYTVVACHTDEEGNEVSGPTDEDFEQVEVEAVLATLELASLEATDLEAGLAQYTQAKVAAYKQMGLKVLQVQSRRVTRKHLYLDWKDIRTKVSTQHTWQMELATPKSVASSLYSPV